MTAENICKTSSPPLISFRVETKREKQEVENMQAQQTIVHSEIGNAVAANNLVAANGKNMPEKKFSAGAISATVWKNNGTSKLGQPVEYRTISLQRSFKKDGAWQNASSLRVNDLPKAALLLNKAFEWLVLKGEGVEHKEETEENTEF